MRHVAFLRAINVGGRVVKMDRLRQLFESAGLARVETFIASGNVLFESRRASASLEVLIEAALQETLGYEVITMVRSAPQVAAIVQHVDAHDLAEGAGVSLYVGLLKQDPGAAAARRVGALSNGIDTLSVHGTELYWRCRKSFSESTITGPVLARSLGVPLTTRNVTTVRKLAARLGD